MNESLRIFQKKHFLKRRQKPKMNLKNVKTISIECRKFNFTKLTSIKMFLILVFQLIENEVLYRRIVSTKPKKFFD